MPLSVEQDYAGSNPADHPNQSRDYEMTVAELVEFLKAQPQDLTVVFCRYSEYARLEFYQLSIKPLCQARPDGWVHDARPDMPTTDYLVFPGN